MGGEETYRAQEGIAFPESELPSPEGPGCESLDPGRVPRLSSSPDPRPGDLHPRGGGFGGAPSLPSLRDRTLPPLLHHPSPHQNRRLRKLRSNSTKLVAGWPLPWSGRIQGPRRPQLPGAPGCTTASSRSPSAGSRPAARAGRSRDPAPSSPAPLGQPRGLRPKALAAE